MTTAVTAPPVRIQTGVTGLDDILHDGLIANRVYLIEGDPGSGKTTLAMQYLLTGARQGEKCLHVSLSESCDELRENAASHGWDLKPIDMVQLAADESALDNDTQLTMYPASEIEFNETVDRVLAAVERSDPTRLVIDSLSELRLMAQDALRYRRQILALKHYFQDRHCTVLLLDDRTVGADQLLHSIAHGVIELEQLAPDYGPGRRRMRVSKLRGSDFRGGYHDFVIRRGGIVVYPRLIAAEHIAQPHYEPIGSGIASLDALLGGGPDRGTSTLFIGPSGSGKSTIAAHYAIAAAARGDHASIFAFDENIRTLENRLRAIGERFTIGNGQGEVELRQVDRAQLSPGEFVQLVRRAVEQHGAKIIVIDSLNGYMNAMPQERFLIEQLHELLGYLGRLGVTTFMVVAQYGLIGSDVRAAVDTSHLADALVLLRYFEDAGQMKKAISVLKKRSGIHEESIREIRFDDYGIHLSEPLDRFRGVLTGISSNGAVPNTEALRRG